MSKRAKSKIGRPPLPDDERRVWLGNQRVEPGTRAFYLEAGRRYGGIGRALDVAATALREMEARVRAVIRPRE